MRLLGRLGRALGRMDLLGGLGDKGFLGFLVLVIWLGLIGGT